MFKSYNNITLIEEFITKEYENYLIDKFPKKEKSSNKIVNNMVRYGRYPTHILHQKEIPEYLSNLSFYIYNKQITPIISDAVQINEYYKGQGFIPHVDGRNNGEPITVLSLGSDTVINFDTKPIINIKLLQRSILSFNGPVRYIKHWIDSKDVIDKRYSIAFRHSIWK